MRRSSARTRSVRLRIPAESDVFSPLCADQDHPPLACRVHMALQGLEWFIYNRTAGYDNIVAQMQDDLPPTPAPTPAGARTSFDARDAVRKMFSRTSTHPEGELTAPVIRNSELILIQPLT